MRSASPYGVRPTRGTQFAELAISANDRPDPDDSSGAKSTSTHDLEGAPLHASPRVRSSAVKAPFAAASSSKFERPASTKREAHTLRLTHTQTL